MTNPLKPRPGSTPELPRASVTEVDRTLYGADKQRRQDQPKRSLTSPGIGLSPPIPPAPAMPLEHARTVKVPADPTTAKTIAAPAASANPYRAASPAAGFDEAPTVVRVTDAADAATRPPEAASYPPAVVVGKPAPVPRAEPATTPPEVDQAIGRVGRHLLKRFGWPAVTSIGIALGLLKPAAAPQKVDANATELAAVKLELGEQRALTEKLVRHVAQADGYAACLASQLAEVGEQTLPAPDKMGSKSLPRPWVERCSILKP